jgi:hypothetical protein
MNNKKRIRKETRPPKHMRNLKRGDIREDGMIFWEYSKNYSSGERWINADKYQIYVSKTKEYEKKRDNRPPKELRTLRNGDIREDGMVFWHYGKSYANGEKWLSKKEFDTRIKRRKQNRKKWKQKNPSWYKEYMREQRKDPLNRIIYAQRTRIMRALKDLKKIDHTIEMIGCSALELRNYIESKFENGMSWDNYGRDGWHIDHIRPCASFDLSDPEQQEECFHYTNLQPLWAKDNLSKGSYYNPQKED